MKYVATLCLLLAASCTAAPSTKSLLTDAIEGMLSANRDKLTNLLLEQIEINNDVVLTNLTITNLENYVINAIDAPNTISLKITNLTVSLNIAGVSGTYDFEEVTVPEIGLANLTGSGELTGRADFLRLELSQLTFQLQGTTTFNLLDFTFVSASVGAAHLTLEDIEQEAADSLAAYLPTYLAEDFPTLVASNKGLIIDKVNELIHQVAP